MPPDTTTPQHAHSAVLVISSHTRITRTERTNQTSRHCTRERWRTGRRQGHTTAVPTPVATTSSQLIFSRPASLIESRPASTQRHANVDVLGSSSCWYGQSSCTAPHHPPPISRQLTFSLRGTPQRSRGAWRCDAHPAPTLFAVVHARTAQLPPLITAIEIWISMREPRSPLAAHHSPPRARALSQVTSRYAPAVDMLPPYAHQLSHPSL